MIKLCCNLPTIINDLVEKFVCGYNKQPLSNGNTLKCENAYDINNGLCEMFAEDLIQILGGENEQQFILSDDMFLCDSYEEAIGLWGKQDLIRTKNGSAWSKEMLSLYSFPLIDDIKTVEYLPSHT